MPKFKVVTLDGKRHIVEAVDIESAPMVIGTEKYNDGKGYKSDDIVTVYSIEEPTFTIRAQDKSAPRSLAFWILENIETAPEAKLKEALAIALRMRDFIDRKNAD